jgi:alpha-tubulin suppressor-like RCC1 family protein
VLLDTPASVSTAGASRIRATASFSVALTHADNGRTLLITEFSCRRAHQAPARANLPASQQYTGAFDVMVFDALIPEPPQAIAPAIAAQPANQAVTAPAVAVFSAAATGTPVPTVQWQQSSDNGATWADIAGATATSYTTPATGAADNGRQLRAVFTNSAGSATSAAATLTVTTPPVTARDHVGRLALAYRHSCAVTSDARLACWGYNSAGQIGQPPSSPAWPTPTIVPLAGAVTHVGADLSGTCAIHNGGTLSCWGSFGGTHVPTVQTGLSGVSAMTFGYAHRCFIAQGEVWCAGDNSLGQLGQGTVGTGNAAALRVAGAIGSGATALVLAAGDYHTCALGSDGTVRCWGAINSETNPQGQLQPTPTPTAVSPGNGAPLNDASDIVAGPAHTCLVRGADLSVWCFGRNNAAQLGLGTQANTHTATPAQVPGLTSVAALAAGSGVGSDQTCAAATTGEVRCWGTGMMGNGDVTTTQRSPALVRGLGSVRALGIGQGHVCALLTTRAMKCWGSNSDGQLGVGAFGVPRTTPTDVVGGLLFWGP